MKILSFFFLLLFNLLTPLTIQGEILSIRIKWTAAACNNNCSIELKKILNGLKGVSEVKYSPSFGEAELIWKPNAKFDYQALRTPLQLFGLRLTGLSAKVQGTITRAGNNFILTSIGDNTSFQLLGSYQEGTQGRYAMKMSVASYPVDKTLAAKLVQAQKSHSLVTISGTIFEPERPPLHLIIEDLSVKVKE